MESESNYKTIDNYSIIDSDNENENESNSSIINNKNVKLNITKNNINNAVNLKYDNIILIIHILHDIDDNISKICIQKNVNNKYISKIYTFGKNISISHPKIIFNETKSFTFKNAIEFANSKLSNNIISIINSDTFLDPHSLYWLHIDQYLNNRNVLCLTASEYLNDNKIWRDKQLSNVLFSVIQSCWIFKTPLNIKNINNLDFNINNHGSCNAFAHELYINKYIPINYSNKFKILHFFNNQSKKGSYPKNMGQLVLPDFEMSKNFDLNTFANKLSLNNEQKYLIKSLMFSLILQIND